MIRISEFLLNFLINAGWQVALILIVAGLGAHLLRNAPSRYRHILWIVALGLSLLAPVLSITQFLPSALRVASFKADSPQNPLTRDNQTQTIVNGTDQQTGIDRLLTRRRQTFSVAPAWLFILSSAYVLILLLHIVRLMRMWRRKEKLRQEACRSKSTPFVEAIVRRCRQALGLGKVSVVCSRLATVPVALGIREPLIVLPEHLCAEADEETLLSIVGHEMAHVARRDFLSNLICELICLPISFHPLTYLIKREIQRTRELACDELVTKHILGPKAYARSLVRAANAMFQPREQALMLSIFDGNILEERILKLTQSQHRLGLRAGRLFMIGCVLALALVTLSSSMLAFDLRAYSRGPSIKPIEFVALPVSESQAQSLARVSQQTIVKQAGRLEAQISAISQEPTDSQNARELALGACAAGQKGDFEAIPRLISMLGDDRQIEPVSCAYGRWSPALETFKHPSPGEQAAIALASMGSPAFQPLLNQLTSSNSAVRRNAAWAIGELTRMIPGERAAAVPQLISLLGDSDKWVQMAAARSLGELRDQRAGEALIATLLDSDSRVRQMAAWALSELKDRRAVQELCRLLASDAQPEVRCGAAEALGEINSAEALPSLKQALNDPEASVRAKVGWAIGEIEGSNDWVKVGRALSLLKPAGK
jgi:bla regulator protein blaR1